MEVVTKIAPIALALIMLALGLGLTGQDFFKSYKAAKRFYCRFNLSTYNTPDHCIYFNKNF